MIAFTGQALVSVRRMMEANEKVDAASGIDYPTTGSLQRRMLHVQLCQFLGFLPFWFG